MTRFRLVPSTHLVLFREGKVLLLRRFQTGWYDGDYSVIAGHLDGNETVRKAMIREAKEEAGIEINEEDLVIVHVMHRKEEQKDKDLVERVDFFVTTATWSGEIQNKEPSKCDDISWFPVDKLPENMVPYVRSGIQSILKKELYSEFGW
ncbi:MAG: NUDIX domain-containing protein [Nanoarchaeota archaeon]|nr:NUDIX domain-containing protein [Nanoarchaeota archaeon]